MLNKGETNLDRFELIDTRSSVLRVASESDLKRLQEHVHTSEETLRRRRKRLERGGTFEYDDSIGQIRRHDEIVFDHEGGLFAVADVSSQFFQLGSFLYVAVVLMC